MSRSADHCQTKELFNSLQAETAHLSHLWWCPMRTKVELGMYENQMSPQEEKHIIPHISWNIPCIFCQHAQNRRLGETRGNNWPRLVSFILINDALSVLPWLVWLQLARERWDPWQFKGNPRDRCAWILMKKRKIFEQKNTGKNFEMSHISWWLLRKKVTSLSNVRWHLNQVWPLTITGGGRIHLYRK